MKLFIHDLLELFSPLIDEGRKLLTPPGAAAAGGGGGGTGAEDEFIGSAELKRKVSGSFSRTSFPTAKSSRFSTNVLIVGRCRGSTCSNVPEIDRRESSERSASVRLTDEIVQNGVTLVARRDGVFRVENPQFRRIFERMIDEAEIVEQTTQGPDVHLFVDRIVVVRVQHFRRAIHRRGHFGHFVLDEIALLHRPTFVRQIDFRRCRAEIAELDETGRS